MYRLLAIADYEDRYVIPQAHAELGQRLMQEQGGCGLDFEDGPGNCGAVTPVRTRPRLYVHGALPPRRPAQARAAGGRRPRLRGRFVVHAALLQSASPARRAQAEVARCRAGRCARRSSGSRGLERRPRALRRDVRPAPPRPSPHVLRARRHARARDGAAAAEEASTAPPGCRWTRELPG
jgi:hypothetical protein